MRLTISINFPYVLLLLADDFLSIGYWLAHRAYDLYFNILQEKRKTKLKLKLILKHLPHLTLTIIAVIIKAKPF